MSSNHATLATWNVARSVASRVVDIGFKAGFDDGSANVDFETLSEEFEVAAEECENWPFEAPEDLILLRKEITDTRKESVLKVGRLLNDHLDADGEGGGLLTESACTHTQVADVEGLDEGVEQIHLYIASNLLATVNGKLGIADVIDSYPGYDFPRRVRLRMRTSNTTSPESATKIAELAEWLASIEDENSDVRKRALEVPMGIEPEEG